MQLDQAVIMYRKRAQNVKRCEFRKFKEWARDYMQEHDITQVDMVVKQLLKLRNEEKRLVAKKGKKQGNGGQWQYPAVQLDTACLQPHQQNQQQKSTNPK